MSGVAKARIERYVDAVREYRALERAVKDEGRTEDRDRALQQAKARAVEYLRVLNGSQLGLAQRILRDQEA